MMTRDKTQYVLDGMTIASLQAECERLRAERDRLREALVNIKQWAEAYSEMVFHEPDFDAMRVVLTEANMPTALDAAHGTWGRHIAVGVGDIARAALDGGK